MEICRKSLLTFLDSGIFLYKCGGINQMILLKAFFVNDLVVCAGLAPEFERARALIHTHMRRYVWTPKGQYKP